MNLNKWVKVRKKRPERKVALRFLVDFPEGIMTPEGPVGPFKKNDLITLEVVGREVAKILIERGLVEVHPL